VDFQCRDTIGFDTMQFWAKGRRIRIQHNQLLIGDESSTNGIGWESTGRNFDTIRHTMKYDVFMVNFPSIPNPIDDLVHDGKT
jgi:hypothetical protein